MNKLQLVIYEIVVLTLTALAIAMIFSLSSQDAGKSSSLSFEVTDVVIKITDPEREIDRGDARYLVNNSIVRQFAHALEYAVLGFLIIAALAPLNWGLLKKILLCVALCALCSVADEWNQSFVSGRGSELKDVLTDIGGACAGLAVALGIRKILLITAEKGAFWRIRKP